MEKNPRSYIFLFYISIFPNSPSEVQGPARTCSKLEMGEARAGIRSALEPLPSDGSYSSPWSSLIHCKTWHLLLSSWGCSSTHGLPFPIWVLKKYSIENKKMSIWGTQLKPCSTTSLWRVTLGQPTNPLNSLLHLQNRYIPNCALLLGRLWTVNKIHLNA